MNAALGRAAALYAGLVSFVTWPQVLQLTTGVSDFGDPLLNSWILAWVAHGLSFDANIFHPETGTLAYSESLLLPGLALAPLSWFGADPILVHNLLLLGSLVLSGLGMFCLVRDLTGRESAAIAAGTLFALSPLRMEHYAKVQIQLTFFMPLALLALSRLAARPAWRQTLALSGATAASLYTCVYLGIYGGIGLAVAGAVLVASARGRQVQLAMALTAAGVLTALFAWPLARAYVSASRVVGERSIEEVQRGSADWRDYLAAHPDGWWHGDPGRPGIGERRLFPGYAAPALAVAALVPPVNVGVLAYAAMGLAAAELSVGINAPAYRFLYDNVRPVRALRVPARFALVVSLALAVLAGYGVARVCRGRSRRVEMIVVGLVVAAAAIEGRMRPLELSRLQDPAPSVYDWLAAQPPGVVCEYPVGRLEGRVGPQDPTYMYYSTRHWQPLVNGYSGFEPASYRELLARLDTFPDDASIGYLRSRGVKYLLVHSPFYIQGDYAADVAALRGLTGLRHAGTFTWRGGGQTAAFIVE